VGALAALPLLSRPAASALAATPAMPLAKIVSLVVPRPDIPAERFPTLWIGEHARTTARITGVAGLVLSEVLQGGAPSPGTPWPFAIAGIETAWVTRPEDARGSGMATDPVDVLSAPATTVIDVSASRRFMVQEQVVVPPLVGERAVKRTLLMVRKEGLARDDFIARWTIGHARLAADVPGLLGCVFNHILPGRDGDRTSELAIDGIAELWWEGMPDNPGARVVTPQADAWLADGDTFTDRDRTRVIVSLDHVIISPPTV
jgi:hypothetical protein